MTRAVDISEDHLEDLLAYDDLFLDYFNTYLQLPVFSTPLYYNRLTGTFLEVSEAERPISGLSQPESPPYGATDEERDNMLEWAKEERLPAFFNSQLFREFKLCKLLLRPLEERGSALRGGSSKIRGYSRQTETDVSSLSNSVDNSANDADLDGMEGVWQPTYSQAYLYRYPRPNSRAFSVPAHIGNGTYQSLIRTEEVNTHGGGAAEPMESTPPREGSYPLYSSNKTSKNPTPMDGKMNGFSPTKQPLDRTLMDLTKVQEVSPTLPVPPRPNNTKDPQRNMSREVTFEEGTLKAPETSVGSGKVTHGSATSQRSGSARRRTSAKKRKGTPGNVNTNQEDAAEEVIEDFDVVYGEAEPAEPPEPMVEFDDAVSEAQTEADARDIEERHRLPIQALKEQCLSGVTGMEDFKTFLSNTSGQDLLNFWLDCEYFKDSMEDQDDYENSRARTRLFREIQDKYKLTLTSEAQRHIIQSASRREGLSHTVFIRTQYDVLRRLRSYWLLRFLVHKERRYGIGPQLFTVPEEGNIEEVFKKLSLVQAIPVLTEDLLLSDVEPPSWESILKKGRRMDSRVHSAKPIKARSIRSKDRTLADKCQRALMNDKLCGGPYRQYLEKFEGSAELLASLTFLEEVMKFTAEQDRLADRMLRLQHAWNIYNSFLTPLSSNFIGISKKDSEEIRLCLLSATDLIDPAIFNDAKSQTVTQLQDSWLTFLKYDLKAFIDAHQNESENGTSRPDEYEIVLNTFEDHLQLYVKGPRPWVKRYPASSASERGHRLHTAISLAETIDEARKEERKKEIAERRRRMEKERKKALKMAKKRMMELRKPPEAKESKEKAKEGEATPDPTNMTDEGTSYPGGGRRSSAAPDKMPTFPDTVKKNKAVIQLYKKYLTDNEMKEAKDLVNMYMDIDAYLHMLKDKTKSGSKEKQVQHIHKTYLESQAKRRIEIPDRIQNKLRLEGQRPKTPTLKDLQHHAGVATEEAFQKFWEHQQEQFGDKNVATMSKAELAMRAQDLGLGGGSFHRSRTKGMRANDPEGHQPQAPPPRRKKKLADGRAQPSREDQMEFYQELTTAALGKLPLKMLYFYKHIVRFTEEDTSFQVPLENDLFFWLEVQKFKENSHAHADEELLNRKVQSMLDCYLESTTPPLIQINVPHEIGQRAQRAAQKYAAGKDLSATMFDDAQLHCFRNLLPYWAGFTRGYKKPTDPNAPLTKKQRDRRKRLEDMLAAASTMGSAHQRLRLPPVPRGLTVGALSYSMSDGLKWRSREALIESLEDMNEMSFENFGDLRDDMPVGTALGNQRGASRLSRVKKTSATTQASVKVK